MWDSSFCYDLRMLQDFRSAEQVKFSTNIMILYFLQFLKEFLNFFLVLGSPWTSVSKLNDFDDRIISHRTSGARFKDGKSGRSPLSLLW